MFIHFNYTFENNFQEVSHKFILLFDSTLIIHEVARTRPTANNGGIDVRHWPAGETFESTHDTSAGPVISFPLKKWDPSNSLVSSVAAAKIL